MEYLCILDFEATCDDADPTLVHEVIEFPSVLLRRDPRSLTREWCTVSEFRRFCRPRDRPILTQYCKRLTGITQQQVDTGMPFPAALAEHTKWLTRHLGQHPDLASATHTFAFATCGRWDLETMLGIERTRYGTAMHVPAAYTRFINVKAVFQRFMGEPKQLGMAEMLLRLQQPLIGRHHCGIDDCRNIATIVKRLEAAGYPWSLPTDVISVKTHNTTQTPPSGC